MPRVHFLKEEKVVEVPAGASLRRVALDNGIDLYEFPNTLPILNCSLNLLVTHFQICAGTCRVRVDDPAGLSARTRWEKFFLGDDEPDLRLACKSEVTGDLEVITQPNHLGWHGHPYYVRANKKAVR